MTLTKKCYVGFHKNTTTDQCVRNKCINNSVKKCKSATKVYDEDFFGKRCPDHSRRTCIAPGSNPATYAAKSYMHDRKRHRHHTKTHVNKNLMQRLLGNRSKSRSRSHTSSSAMPGLIPLKSRSNAKQTLFERVMGNEKVHAELKKNPKLLTEIIKHPSIAKKVISHPGLTVEILQNPEVAKKKKTEPAIVAEFLKNPSASKKLLSDPQVVREMIKNPSVINVVNNNADVAKEVIENPKVIKELSVGNIKGKSSKSASKPKRKGILGFFGL